MNLRYFICLALLLACGRADPPASSPEPPMEEPELVNLSVDASLPLVAVDAASQARARAVSTTASRRRVITESGVGTPEHELTWGDQPRG